MNKHLFLTGAVCLTLTTTASLATAGERQREDHLSQRSAQHSGDSHHTRANRSAQGFDHSMQVVPTTAGAGQAGHGWQYFSDPAAHRAVVISPQGEYFLSRGKGMRLVAVTQPQS